MQLERLATPWRGRSFPAAPILRQAAAVRPQAAIALPGGHFGIAHGAAGGDGIAARDQRPAQVEPIRLALAEAAASWAGYEGAPAFLAACARQAGPRGVTPP